MANLQEKSETKNQDIERLLTKAMLEIAKFRDYPDLLRESVEYNLLLAHAYGKVEGYDSGLKTGAILQKLDTEAKEIKQAEQALGITDPGEDEGDEDEDGWREPDLNPDNYFPGNYDEDFDEEDQEHRDNIWIGDHELNDLNPGYE